MKVKLFAAFFFFSVCTFSVKAQEEITLEQVIALSIDKNYNIQLLKNSRDAAATDNGYAFGAFLPTLNGTASKTWTSNKQRVEFPKERDSLNNEGVGKASNTSASLQLSWVLFDGTKMFATRERIAVLEAQGELNLKNQIVNTIAQVIVNYFDVVRQKQQLKAIQEQMAVSDERVKLASRKLEVGTGGKPELLQAKVDYNAFRTQAIQQESAIEQLKQQLNGLTGMQLATQFDVADSIVIDLNINESQILDNLENRNYSLLSAKRGIEIARLITRERRGELFPVISLNANYNYNTVDNSVLINRLNPIFTRGQGYNYGVFATIPVFNGLNKRREIQQSKLNLLRQEVIYQQSKSVVDVGVRNALIGYENAKRILLVEEENILLAKENVYIALETFRRGVTTFIELRTAQQSLADAYNRLITARFNAKSAETELLRLNGSLLR